MAAKFPSASNVQLRPRKGHDMTWSCDKHAEPIKFYCKKHSTPLCHPCAFKDHGHKPCELDDIEDVILKMGKKLEDKLPELDEAIKRSNRLNSEIQSCPAFVSHHLETMNDEVNIAYEDKIKSVKDKEREEILLINEEADEEIRIINEKRGRRVKSRSAEAEKQQRSIQDTQEKLLSGSKKIDTTIGEKIEDLKKINQHNIDTMENIGSKIKRIKKHDKTLVNKAPQVIASLDESVKTNVNQDILDCLNLLKCEVQKVKFVEGKIGGEHYARIDGYIGKWELVKSIDIPSNIHIPFVCGLISNDELCVLDEKNHDLYVTNISNVHIHKVIEGDRYMYITSCAPVDSDLIVCGKYRTQCMGDSLEKCITLYDRQWKVVRDIAIPKNAASSNRAYVDVDKDGMILAAECDQSNIYVINPADGKIVNTITMQGKMVIGLIQTLSSGDIVVMTSKTEFTVISRSGEEKATILCDEWVSPWCHVDKLTDTICITYWDQKRRIYAVDQVSCDGNIQARRVVECKASDRSVYYSPCLITPSGNLTVGIKDKILVYKKRFVV